MKRDRWRQVDDLFEAALEREPKSARHFSNALAATTASFGEKSKRCSGLIF